MAITANAGPYVAFGQSQRALDYNPDLGTCLSYAGWGIMDPRQPFAYEPGNADSVPTVGFLGTTAISTINAVPYTKATQAIAANANVSTGVNMTLVSANSATTGVSIVPVVYNSSTNVADTGVNGAGLVGIDTFTSVTATVSGSVLTVTVSGSKTVAIGQTVLTAGGTLTGITPVGMQIIPGGTGNGGVGTYFLNGVAETVGSGTITLQTQGPQNSILSYAQQGAISLWNPQSLIGRAVAITCGAGASGGAFTVEGYDIYGFPMIETITAVTNSQVSGKKAFKYVKAVTPGFTDANNYSVDTTDIIGLPIRSDTFGDVLINYSASLNPALITANTGYVASDATTPATATTGDVRGTYTLQTAASTGANRLTVRQTPQAANVGFSDGLFGPSQYSTGFF